MSRLVLPNDQRKDSSMPRTDRQDAERGVGVSLSAADPWQNCGQLRYSAIWFGWISSVAEFKGLQYEKPRPMIILAELTLDATT